MCKTSFFAAAVLIWTIAAIAYSQENVNKVPTPAELLTREHVPLTRPGLLSALGSDSANIRDLAAAELAVQHAKDAVPDIYGALIVEHVPAVRVNMAYSLAQLGDPRGRNSLRDDCTTRGLRMDLRLTAASYLAQLHDASCIDTIFEALQPNVSSDVQVQALSLIPEFAKLDERIASQLNALLLRSLSAGEASVRLEASDVIRNLGDRSAIPALEAAIAGESDDEVRAVMQASLETLRKPKP